MIKKAISILAFSFCCITYSQNGTIHVEKEKVNMFLYALEGNYIGEPQSYILLLDRGKSLFVNGWITGEEVYENISEDKLIDADITKGYYKRNGNQIFIFFNKGLSYTGTKSETSLFLIDNSGYKMKYSLVVL